MFSLFNARPVGQRGSVIFPGYGYVQRGLSQNLATTVNYYRAHPKFVDAKHLLVRLLQNINVPLTLEPWIYADKASDKALDLAMAMGLTSPLSRGKVWPGVFYGPEVSEVYIASIEPFDTTNWQSTWQDWQPIRVLTHPKTDLTLHVPDGAYRTPEIGIAVFSINIPMLATQYRIWRELTVRQAQNDSPPSIGHFLYAYPLTNILPSHLDVVILNRLMALFFEQPILKLRSPHPFAMPHYGPQLDVVLNQLLQALYRRSLDFDSIIDQIPTVTAIDAHEVVALPAIPYNQQVQWAATLARLPLLAFLLQLNYVTDNAKNQLYKSRIKRYLILSDSNHLLKTALPPSLYTWVDDLLKNEVWPYL